MTLKIFKSKGLWKKGKKLVETIKPKWNVEETAGDKTYYSPLGQYKIHFQWVGNGGFYNRNVMGGTERSMAWAVNRKTDNPAYASAEGFNTGQTWKFRTLKKAKEFCERQENAEKEII